MSKYLDETKVVKTVWDILERAGFEARDADESDFSRPDDPFGTRFKTGTSYGEVTITVWCGKNMVDAIRILNEHTSWEEGKRLLDLYLSGVKS